MSTKHADFDSIMQTITDGLTGDVQKDTAYLQKQMEMYKDHEFSKEILRACGRLLYDLLPDDKKEELNKLLDNHAMGADAVMEEVRFNIFKKDFDKAQKIIVPFIEKIESLNMFQDDQVSEYHTFNELFEEILYSVKTNPTKEVRKSDIPYSEIYLLYGSLLFELKRYEDARKVLEKALHWNPVNAKIWFEYIETYKMTGELDEFFQLSVDTIQYAFHSEDLARCYRNLGYYFIEKELYSEAIGCYLLSGNIDNQSTNLQSELYYIHSVTEGKVSEPSFSQVREYSEKYGFPIGADKTVLEIAYSIGKDCFEKKMYEPARYLLTIAYGLVKDDEIKEMLEQIQDGNKL